MTAVKRHARVGFADARCMKVFVAQSQIGMWVLRPKVLDMAVLLNN